MIIYIINKNNDKIYNQGVSARVEAGEDESNEVLVQTLEGGLSPEVDLRRPDGDPGMRVVPAADPEIRTVQID